MADLMTLNELKDALGVDRTDTTDDVTLQSALTKASAAIVRYTERDFASPQVTETRKYQYDQCGFLDIDDATDITQVSITYPNTPDLVLTTDQWLAQPPLSANNPVYDRLMVAFASPGVSPEMGFTYNLDVLYRERRWPGLQPTTVNVTATFGWPEVPEDVKQAVVWTASAFKDNPSPWITTSQSIEGFTQSFSRANTVEEAIPERAKDLLAPYLREGV